MISRRRFVLAALMLSSVSFATCSKPQNPTPDTVPLFDDLCTYHRTVTTSSEPAQKYFDQGLRLIYGFNHDEAERAFREAIRLDANCAMAWWGVAYALGPNYNLPMAPEQNAKALEAVQKAQALRPRVSEADAAYVDAIATRYSANPKTDRTELNR